MLTILHELLPVVYTPIAKLFTRAHVGVHFQTLFKTLKRIIKVTSNCPNGGPKRYVPVLARFTNDLYSFLHESAANDDSSVENTIKWLESLVAFAREETIDLEPLLSSLNETTFSSLVQELDNIKAFYDYRALLKQMEYDEDEYDEEDEEGEEKEIEPMEEKENKKNKESLKSNKAEKSPKPKSPKSNTATSTNPTTTESNEPSQLDSPNQTQSSQPDTETTHIPEVPRPTLMIIPQLIDDFIELVRPKLTLGAVTTTTNTTSSTASQDVKQELTSPPTVSVGLPHE